MFKKKSAIKKIIAQYVDELSQEIVVNNVFVFGSAARGKMTKDSDIDLIVLSRDFTKMNFMKRLQLLSRVSIVCAGDAALDAIGYTPKEFSDLSKVGSLALDKIKTQGYFYK